MFFSHVTDHDKSKPEKVLLVTYCVSAPSKIQHDLHYYMIGICLLKHGWGTLQSKEYFGFLPTYNHLEHKSHKLKKPLKC